MDFVFTYTDGKVLLLVIAFYVIMNLVGCLRKKAWYAMFSSFLCLASLIVHISLRRIFGIKELILNGSLDMVFLAINLTFLLIVDEIESRRSLIKNVFENRYKNKRK